jgi:hypothetical protein
VEITSNNILDGIGDLKKETHMFKCFFALALTILSINAQATSVGVAKAPCREVNIKEAMDGVGISNAKSSYNFGFLSGYITAKSRQTGIEIDFLDTMDRLESQCQPNPDMTLEDALEVVLKN